MQFMQQELVCSTMDQYRIIRTLGSGYHSTVKLAMDPKGIPVGIKRYRIETANIGTLSKEVHVMKDLNHQNIIRLIDVRDKAEYRNRQGITYRCLALIIEYASNGELYNYLAYSKRFSEKVARSYFNQMMNGLYYLHKMGYAHRDLKPENILLSHDFVLKIADFGFSTVMEGRDKSGILHTNCGSQLYKAPEIQSLNYVGWQADVFAAGVILFIMVKGRPPFENSKITDPVYALIKQKNYRVFWKLHSKRNPTIFAEDFKDLFVRMVAYDPNERPKIEEIANNSWVRKQVCSRQQLMNEFNERKIKVDQKLQELRNEEQQRRMQMIENNMQSERSGECKQNKFYSLYVSEMNKKRELQSFELQSGDGFYAKQKVEYFVANLKDSLEKDDIAIQQGDTEQESIIDDDQQQEFHCALKFESIKQLPNNKMTFSYVYTQSMGAVALKSEVEIQLSLGLSKKEKDLLVVNIKKVRGQHILYKKIVNEIKKKFIYCIYNQVKETCAKKQQNI